MYKLYVSFISKINLCGTPHKPNKAYLSGINLVTLNSSEIQFSAFSEVLIIPTWSSCSETRGHRCSPDTILKRMNRGTGHYFFSIFMKIELITGHMFFHFSQSFYDE